MAKNAISSGKKMDVTAPAGGVISGALKKFGAMWMVMSSTVAATEKVVGNLEGEYDLSADVAAGSGAAVQGQNMYAIPASGLVTASAAGNELIGVASEISLDADVTKKVRLSGIPV